MERKTNYYAYQDKFYIARHLYSVLAIVNSVSQYAFLCCENSGIKLRKLIEISVNIRNFKSRLKLVCLFELQVEINLIIRKSV